MRTVVRAGYELVRPIPRLMRRREFLKLTGGAAITAGGILPELQESHAEAEAASHQRPIIMSSMCRPQEMTEVRERRTQPFATLARAQRAAREAKHRNSGPIYVWIRGGSYYLQSPLTFESQDSGTATAPVIYAAQPGEDVVISGGRSLSLRWIPYKNEIMKASVPTGLNFTQMFVNGKRQIRARYPNYDPSQPGKSGYLQAAGQSHMTHRTLTQDPMRT